MRQHKAMPTIIDHVELQALTAVAAQLVEVLPADEVDRDPRLVLAHLREQRTAVHVGYRVQQLATREARRVVSCRRR